MSSGKSHGRWEGSIFGIELAGLKAVVESAEEAVEQVALGRGVPVAGGAAAVVVRTGTGREAEGGEAPGVADGRQALVLHAPMEHEAAFATGAGDRGRAGVGVERASVAEADGIVADLGQDAGGREFAQTREAEQDRGIRVLVQVGDGRLGQLLGSLAGGFQLLE